MPEEMRRAMLCGWIPGEQWTASALGMFDVGEPYEPPICPGWMMRQPLVREASEAWKAFDKGQLGEVFPDAPNVLVEGVFVMDGALAHKQKLERPTRDSDG